MLALCRSETIRIRNHRLASHVLFDEPLTRTMIAGIGLIIGGVLLIELGAAH